MKTAEKDNKPFQAEEEKELCWRWKMINEYARKPPKVMLMLVVFDSKLTFDLVGLIEFYFWNLYIAFVLVNHEKTGCRRKQGHCDWEL